MADPEVLFVSPWLESFSVSPTFQILREELSYCSQPVTLAKLEPLLPAEELGRYKDLFRYASRFPVSLGILAIASFLDLHGIASDYLVLEAERQDSGSAEGWLERALAGALEPPGLRAVGFTANTNEMHRVEKACTVVRALRPELPIVLGGPHVTFRPGDLLEQGLADIVVRGEGEWPMLEIVERLRTGKTLDGIPSTTVCRNGRVISHLPGRAADLREMPVPRHDRLEPGIAKRGVLYAMYTRGCPNLCAHCVDGRLFGPKLRSYSPAALVDSIEVIADKMEWRFIHLADSSFGASPETVEALCDELERRSARFLFSVNARPDLHRTLDEEHVRRLRALGFVEFLIGGESGSDRVLEAVGRNHRTEDLVATLEMLRDCGVPMASTYWMIGLPFETTADILATADLVRRLLDDDLTHFATSKPFIPVPGTPPFEDPERWGIEIVSHDWELYTRYGQPLPYRHRYLSAGEIEAGTLLLQAIMAGAFQRRSGLARYDLEALKERVRASYEDGLYM